METTLTATPILGLARVALSGNPNTGKSTLFNALTGYRQRVANYPGVTVERKTGLLRGIEGGRRIDLIDLPGAYSLSAESADEAIVLDTLTGEGALPQPPDGIVCIVDATRLRRNLFLVSQILELGRPVAVALNMVDLAAQAGFAIDSERLSRLLGVPVVPVVATQGRGVDELRRAIVEMLNGPNSVHCAEFPACVRTELDGLHDSVTRQCTDPPCLASRAELLQTLLDPGGYHEERLTRLCGRAIAGELAARRGRIAEAGENIAEVEARVRYAWIEQVVAESVTRQSAKPTTRTDAVDRILTHPVAGLLVFLLLMGIIFQSIYAWAAPVMDVIDQSFSAWGAWAAGHLPAGAMQSLLANGVFAGVGAVLVFLPQILVLFLFLALLEDCGYMARAAMLMDRYMGRLGLSGKAFIPLLSSFACAVPGILATRTIEHPRERLLTILIAPLMSCSARLPVYILLIGAFVPARTLLGGAVHLQAAVLLAMYLVGVIVALPVAWILRRTILRGAPQPLLIELPTFKWPSPSTALFRLYEQGRAFVVQAGTIIFAVTIVVWALGYYPRSDTIAREHQAQRDAVESEYDGQVTAIAAEYDPALRAAALGGAASLAEPIQTIHDIEEEFDERAVGEKWEPDSAPWRTARWEADRRIDNAVRAAGEAGSLARAIYPSWRDREQALGRVNLDESGAALRHSLLGRMGRWVEPVVRPLGWDWRIGTAAIASFPAREVVIATMGTIYNLGGDEDENSAGLRSRLREAKWPDGRPVFNLAVALSIMVFFALCCQCGATLAAIKRETHSWRWPILTFVYMTTLAYVAAWGTYEVAIRLI
jgi:ferrous iron transport protein B